MKKDTTHHYHHRIINRLIIIAYLNFAGQLDPDMRSQKRYSFLLFLFVLIVIFEDVSGPKFEVNIKMQLLEHVSRMYCKNFETI